MTAPYYQTSDYIGHALGLMRSERIPDHLAVVTVEAVSAGTLKPEFAIAFAKSVAPRIAPGADLGHHRQAVNQLLNDPGFAGYRATPPAPPAAPASQQPQHRPGSIEALAEALKGGLARQSAGTVGIHPISNPQRSNKS
jgi:hypothetical protein